MKPRSCVLSFLGTAALAALVALAGCATTAPQPVTSPPPASSSGDTAWHQARVGDRVVYAYSANRKNPGDTTEVRLAGRLTLEVVAVQAPWVWMKLSFQDEAGRPSAGLLLSRELVLPMRMEASRPLEWAREGTPSAEELSASGRTWEAQRYIRDNRPADGPLENRLYAASPGPLYLMNGLLSASNTLSGFGASGGEQLTLVELQQGAEGRTATPPSLQHPLGPGTWSDTRVNAGNGPQLHRTCLSAERGFVLTSTSPAPSSGSAPCPHFADAELLPLEEALLAWVSWLTTQVHSPMILRGGAAQHGTLALKGRSVPALTLEASEKSEGAQQLRYESYAAEPWGAGLDGLHYLARFSALAEGVLRVEDQGVRKPTFTRELTDWGVWAGGAK